MRDVVDRILAFEVDDDPGVPLGFRDRLARENGWSRAHADRVYDEYLRFLALAATGDRPVTPSDAVDQAWHLHLTYTRSYWDRLCGEVLGRPLHHGPTRGTPDDGRLYRDQYAATLAAYRSTFGEEPPADIWPGGAERFRDPGRWQRVDTASHLVVRRAPVVAGGAAAVLVGAATAAAGREDTGAGVALLVGVVVVAFVIVLVVVSASRRAGGGGRRPDRRRGSWQDGGVFFFGGDGGSHHDGGGWDGGGGDSSGGCGADGGDGGGGGGGCGGGGCGGGGCGGGG